MWTKVSSVKALLLQLHGDDATPGYAFPLTSATSLFLRTWGEKLVRLYRHSTAQHCDKIKYDPLEDGKTWEILPRLKEKPVHPVWLN